MRKLLKYAMKPLIPILAISLMSSTVVLANGPRKVNPPELMEWPEVPPITINADGTWNIDPATARALSERLLDYANMPVLCNATLGEQRRVDGASCALDIQRARQEGWAWWQVTLAVAGGVVLGAVVGLVVGFASGVTL